MNRSFPWTKRKKILYRPNRNNEEDDDDEETNIIYCRSSNTSNNGQEMQTSKVKEQYLEKELQPNDTLQSLALEFNCPVAELKRVNKIIRENEIFARKVIKIPVKYYSLLSEQLPSVHTGINENKKEEPSTSNENLTIANITQVYIAPKVKRLEDSSEQTDNIEVTESDVLLSCSSDDLPKIEDKGVLNCNGSDWGLSWCHVLMFAILMALIIPVICYLYISKITNGHHHFNITHVSSTLKNSTINQ